MLRDMRIVALGGGGFMLEPANPLLDDYILSLARQPNPRICFVPTGRGDSGNYCFQFYGAFASRRCVTSDLALFPRKIADLRSFVLQQDVIYVGGGSTANMLAVWRVHGLDAIFREAAENGVLLSGVSAGAMCWFEAGLTDSFGPELTPFTNGLGFLRGSACPHYDADPRRQSALRRFIADGTLPAGYAVDDGCALYLEGADLKAVVSSRPHARAYRVERCDGGMLEQPLDSQYLG